MRFVPSWSIKHLLVDSARAENRFGREEKTMRASLGSLCILLVCASAVAAHATGEKSISRSDLPVAVQKTADEQAKGASVRGYSKDKENGRLEYEVEMVVNGHSKDVTITPGGHLLEIEEEIDLGSLSPQVRSGLVAKAGKGKIVKVETITKQGAIVAYEAQVLKAGRRSEVQVGPDGAPLDHEE
jgi:hypothetical protein